MLTVNTFKKFCLKADEIHDYLNKFFAEENSIIRNQVKKIKKNLRILYWMKKKNI